MSFLGLGKAAERYGVIIDIGSGSVLAAIVHSVPNQPHPHVVWSQREHAPLRNIDALEQSSKAVITALMNISMLVDAEGRKALYEYNKTAKITELQCTIAAPWSYTVTKQVEYNQTEEFEITEELIEELIASINEQVDADLQNNQDLQNLGLKAITRTTMDMLSNGYRVDDPTGNSANKLTISHATVVSPQQIVDSVQEMHDKLFPTTEPYSLSFMLMLYNMYRTVLPDLYDVGLVDITYEATEIGIVRDGTLRYSTHTPFGIFSLAREITAITDVPLHEAFSYLHEDVPLRFMKSLPASQMKEVDTLFESYIDRIAELFQETGDALSIPKRLALHTDLNTEPTFTHLLEKAGRRAIKTEPHITPIAKIIIDQLYQGDDAEVTAATPADSALLVSAQFFHKQAHDGSFLYL